MLNIKRAQVAQAVDSTPNLAVAARKLGASRRTLQNRMREYHMPYGQAGRRRGSSVLGGGGDEAGTLLVMAGVAGVAYLVGKWLFKKVGEP